MYLWQDVPGGFYAPCVDGDFDMSVIGHEYTHAISNRMVGGANDRINGPQGGAMGESWSDLVAVEYLQEHGFAPVGGENPFAVGPYVTGDPQAGIRNFGMNSSPLNYSDIAYDLVGQQVHADGEIWSATNFDIRQALNSRYDGQFPSGNSSLQESCAAGETPVTQCPGNRRWIQLVFDAWPLMSSAPSMVEARNAMLAADQIRFNGANEDLLWNVFASRGLGQFASSNTNADADPVPSFESPHLNEATVTFRPTGRGEAGSLNDVELFVGDYEARVVPIADTNPGTATSNTFKLIPGTYDLIARADGWGMRRFQITVQAGEVRQLPVILERNLASAANGATASGDGVNLDKLIDDTEATNWASLGAAIENKTVAVALGPGSSAHEVQRVQVSAMLRPTIENDPGGDTGGQSRYSALRQFEILSCDATGGTDCSNMANYELIFTSPEDSFPAVAPRPRAPDLIMRSFDVPQTQASHVALRVVTNQCTGTPDFAGDQDNDPRHITDCADGSAQDTFVRAAELQVFSR